MRGFACCVLAGLTVSACVEPTQPAATPEVEAQAAWVGLGTSMSITVTDLGKLFSSDTFSVAFAINDSSVVTGYSATSAIERAFRWRAATGLAWIGVYGRGIDINRAGTIVGYDRNSQEAFRKPMTQFAQLLGKLPNHTHSLAVGINDDGYIVGHSEWPGAPSAGQIVGVRWDPNGLLTDTYMPAGHDRSFLRAVNASLQVVGGAEPEVFQIPALPDDGFRFTPGPGYQFIPPTSGPPITWARPNGINQFGHVVGTELVNTGSGNPIRWMPSTGTELLGVKGAAFAINQFGYMVGYVDGLTNCRPVFWKPNKQVVSLPRLASSPPTVCTHYQATDPTPFGGYSGDFAPLLTAAFDINKRLEIVGKDLAPNGEVHAVLWKVTFTTVVATAFCCQPLYQGSATTIAVAILGENSTADNIPLRDLDPAILTLGDRVGRDTPVARDGNGRPLSSIEDVNRDGLPDLVVQFRQQDLEANGDLTSSTRELVLFGDLDDGREIVGTSAVQVLPRR